MNTDNWKLELDHLLEIFERESTTSLRKINRCFVASGCPFDEEFRKYFVDMSNRRLNTSFDMVLFERQLDDRMKMSSDASAPTNDNKSGNNSNIPYLDDGHGQPMNVRENENTLGLKVERDVADAPIEIVDSDDENVVEVKQLPAADDPIEDQAELKKLLESNDDDVNIDHGQNDADFNDTNDDVEVDIEQKVRDENEIETEEDLPFIGFDPNEVENGVEIDEYSNGQTQSSPSPNVQKKSKLADSKRFECTQCEYSSPSKVNVKKHQLIHATAAKPFKCGHCNYATRNKSHLKSHQRMHDQQKSMGIEQNPNDGLYNCPHCDQKFTKWYSLGLHMTVSHKNNQRLFNCKQCMRRFTRITEKNRHELRCKGRRYECYLCKKYVARDVTQMQDHMRTHLGEKAFECAICNRCFRKKPDLRRHLNTIHTRAQN